MSGYVGSAGVGKLADRLFNVPPEARRKVGTNLRAAAQPVIAAARGNASWSTRIPAALGIRNVYSGGGAGVFFIARASVAPHARPYEGLAGGAFFRHPLNYPHQSGWVRQATRPFLRPAVQAGQSGLVAAVHKGITDAIAI